MVEIDIVTKADKEHKIIKDRGKEIMSKFPNQYYATKEAWITDNDSEINLSGETLEELQSLIVKAKSLTIKRENYVDELK